MKKIGKERKQVEIMKKIKKTRLTAWILTAALGLGSIGMQALPYAGTRLLGNEAVTVQAAAKPSPKKLAKAVRKVYEFVPDTEVSAAEIESDYGISSSLYSSAYVVRPMVNVQVDELSIYKAKDSASKKKIVSALKKYKKKKVESTFNYPMNLLKLQAAKIYKNGDYVCFIVLGQISKQIEENGTEEEMIKAYQKQNNKAVKAIKKQLK